MLGIFPQAIHISELQMTISPPVKKQELVHHANSQWWPQAGKAQEISEVLLHF